MIAFPSSPSPRLWPHLYIYFLFFFSIVFYANRDLIISASGISSEERSIILQEHNRLRQLVATGRYPGQPGAENMREIVWDDELAARAQQWADNCQFRHDPHRTISKLFALPFAYPCCSSYSSNPIQSIPSTKPTLRQAAALGLEVCMFLNRIIQSYRHVVSSGKTL